MRGLHLLTLSLLSCMPFTGKAQNCLVIPGADEFYHNTNIPLIQAALDDTLVGSGVLAKVDHLVLGRSSYLLRATVLQDGTATIVKVSPDTVVSLSSMTVEQSILVALANYQSTEFRVLCANTTYDVPMEMFRILCNGKSVVITSAYGKLIQTLSNHIEFFELPLSVNKALLLQPPAAHVRQGRR